MSQPQPTLQQDNHPNDVDSAYGDDSDRESQTTTIKSIATKHYYQNGRRYHAYCRGAYWGPNDKLACENLDLYHRIFRLTFNDKLFLAPISHPNRVLDLGTGTGLWAIEFADMFPEASIIGVDLSPIQPKAIPPNLEFQIDDFCLPWTFTKESFDYIHARSIYGCVADIPALYGQVMQHLRPGGWYEQVEISVVPKSEDRSIAGTALEEWGSHALEGGDCFGKTFRVAENTEQFFRDAGFQRVTYQTYKWPIGPWPEAEEYKEIGELNRLGWERGLGDWAMYIFTNFMGWTKAEVDEFLDQIRTNLRNASIHAYQTISVCYGQKPMT